MARHMITTVVPQNLAFECTTVAVRYSTEGCPTIAGHFLALAHAIARAAEAAPPHSCKFEVGAEWAPGADLAGTHTTVSGCLLTMDEDERQDLALWAHNVTRETLTDPSILRAARLVRDWLRADARPNDLGEPTRVLSAVDDVFYV